MPFHGGSRGVLRFSESRAPTISNIVPTQLTGTSYQVTWTTNLSTSSDTVNSGLSTSYGTNASATNGTSHSATISNLSEVTTYHFRVRSTANGKETVSADQTILLQRELPRFGPMASLAVAFVNSVPNVSDDPGAVTTSRSSPYTKRDVSIGGGTGITNSAPSMNLYIRTNSFSMGFDSIVSADGEVGGDASEFAAGNGGRGYNGGGGGGTSDEAGAAGGSGGSGGSGNGANGEDNSATSAAGLGAAGMGSDGYAYGADPEAAGNGGPVFTSGNGAGGGGSGGRIVLCSNEFTSSVSGSHSFSAIGGNGSSASVGDATGGDNGGHGVLLMWFRKYSGNIVDGEWNLFGLSAIKLYEVVGTPGNYTYVEHADLLDTWNHL